MDAIRKMAGSIRNFIARGVLESSDDSKKTQIVQASLMEGEIGTDLPVFHPYGLTSRPLKGAEVLVVFPGGNRDHPIVLAVGDPRTRIKGLAEGEVALWNHQGTKVVLRLGGVIEVTASTKVEVTTPLLKVIGNIESTGQISDANGSMQEMRNAYNPHHHPETGGNTGIPDTQMT